MPGLSQEHTIEDCYSLKSLFNKATSGFYWVLPLCAPNPLRAYCDVASGATYVTIPDNDGIVSVGDAVTACTSEQLQPTHVHNSVEITYNTQDWAWSLYICEAAVKLGRCSEC